MENTIIITGRLGADPETKDKGRGPYTRASLAHSQGHYDKQSRQWVDADTPTAWFTVIAYNKTGEQLATMHKGDMIMVCGKLTVNEWTPEAGTGPAPVGTRTDLTIWASSVALVSRKQQGQGGAQAQAAGYAPAQPAPAAPQQAYPTASPWAAYNNPDF